MPKGTAIKTAIEIKFEASNKAEAWASKFQEGGRIRDAMITTVEVVGCTLRIVVESVADMALVIYGSVKDSLPWQYQSHCSCKALT